MKDNILEAALYVQGDEGLTLEQIKELFSLNNIVEAKKVINDFIKKYNESNRGLKVVEFNEVYKLATRESVKEYISKIVNVIRKQKLSNAAIEVAGIIAYKQPITRGQIASIRGISSDQVLNTLLAKGVVEEVGISPTVGHPVLYGVTNKFYDYFRIKSLSELPKLTEFNFVEGTEENATEYDLFESQREEF
ncbi:segregation/condensation protein B [Mycoplasma anatis]|uniref:Segregation and condensation protein B n=1 Tax=Mycoplasmopsis anatis TaxID=171279 RepID=A0A9Q3QDR7_9BACT|nr:SMC-Scp complex subunit ScpB [Mycoplasmopsis anatis]MBW0596345.1 segregation/condensation protein B [Mycoplasmopsis anatis]MBW0597088.1 segregation/condensation protein B [Mycoplasmopsis anatis]MBW0597842.1 segregation/condensation protein B [Mycoplasmopsis anatis]MBW0600023.1 segregation/condensation protein B [Mycoplasmopsis anatis]MBW0600722.1 segregation/condensation protein B [Mycoplasmopsis anatis]